jgi:adenylate cyclase
VAEVSRWKQQAALSGKPAVSVGAAVATGRMIFGTVGFESRLEYTVIGEVVNLCAKLEKHTKTVPADALCTAETHRIAVAQGYRASSPQPVIQDCRVEGLPQPVDIVVLAGPSENPP